MTHVHSEMAGLLRRYAGEETASEARTEWTAYGRNTTPGWQELAHPSRILNEHSERSLRVGELYDRILEDTDIGGLFDKRWKAVLQLPRWVRPADSSPSAAETAAFVRQALGIIPQRIVNLRHDLEQIARGVAISELMWEEIQRGPLSGAWVPVDVIDRPMWRFAWHRGTRELHVRRRGAMPMPAPWGKFLVGTHGTKDYPQGKALLDQLFWFWLIKKHASKYWAVYVERFAMPLAHATYKHRIGGEGAEAFNQEQQELLLAAIESIRTGRGIVHPEGTVLAFLEASRAGDSSYGTFVSWLTRGMALLTLGEVDTSGMGRGTGSFAKSRVSNEVRLETVAHDAGVLGSFHTDALARLLVTVNFGPDYPVPKIAYDSTDATDRGVRAEGIDRALKNGERVPKAYARMTWQIPDVQEGEEFLEIPRPSAPPASSPPNLSLAAEDFADLAASVLRLETDLSEVIATMEVSSLDYFAEHRERLAALWSSDPRAASILPSLVSSSSADVHAEAIQTAQIHGAGLALLQLSAELAGEPSVKLEVPPGALSARTPATALEFWLRILTVPKAFFLELAEAFRKVAFSVAGLTEASALLEADRLLGRAIAEGMDRGTFVRELEEVYAKQGLTPTSPWHAALIYQNNVRAAAHLVRWQQTVGNPAAHRLIPYLMWWTLDDRKVRDGRRPLHNHQVVHGWIGAIGHEFWRTWWPLAGHSCRCGVSTINVAEARRRGLTGAEPSGEWPTNPETGAPALPDPGFRGRPNLEFVHQTTIDRARELVEAARTRGSSGLIEALRLLFTTLGLAAEVFGGDNS